MPTNGDSKGRDPAREPQMQGNKGAQSAETGATPDSGNGDKGGDDGGTNRRKILGFLAIVFLYSVLGSISFFARPIAEWTGVKVLRWEPEPTWIKLEADSLLVRLEADSVRVDILPDMARAQLPDSAWARVALDSTWVGFRAHSVQVMRLPRARIQELEDGIVLFGVLGVLAFLALAGYVREQREDRWAWITIFVLVGILIVLGVEVIEWLKFGAARKFGTVEMLEGVLLASAFGGVTYVLINVGGSVRDLIEGEQRVYRPRRVALEACRDKLIKEMQEKCIAEKPSSDPAAWLRAVQLHQQQIRQLEGDIIKALRDETSEDKQEIIAALNRLSIHRRLFHVLMSMGLATGFAVLASSVGVDAFQERGADDALKVLGFSFLVGMFPRVFESFLRGIADRLVGEEVDQKPPGGSPAASPGPPKPLENGGGNAGAPGNGETVAAPAAEDTQGKVTSSETQESKETNEKPRGGFDVQLPDQPGEGG